MRMAAYMPGIDISAIGLYEPPWILPNEWFGDTLPSKFVQHTGIESRRVSVDDEVTMAARAVENLQRETGCRLRDCAGVVFAASSLLSPPIGKRYRGEGCVWAEQLGCATRRFVKRLGIAGASVAAINWGCSGYAKALAVARRRAAGLKKGQFILAVTVNRTSKIIDYSCRQTAGLFGDFAQATLLVRSDSDKYPVHFELLSAGAETEPVDGVFFDFHVRENVPVPTADSGRRCVPARLVFSLNGMGIGDAASRAMATVAEKALRAARIDPGKVRFVIPHQAGTGIVRLAAERLKMIGVRGELINGLTRQLGNISSSSVPQAIRSEWDRLDGIILCPTAGVGNPGDATVTRGCVILETTQTHRLAVAVDRGLGRAS